MFQINKYVFRFNGRFRGGYVPGGGTHIPVRSSGNPLSTPPAQVHAGIHPRGQTHTCENITFPQTSLAGGNNLVKNYTQIKT